MVGLERAVLPLLGESEFGLGSRTAILAFVASFGATKALANLAAGALADRAGRRPVLLWGWLIGLLVPVIVIAAPTWGWIVFANALLGVNQGLCWSTTVIMKVDLVGPARRGLALGVNEFAGYIAVGLAAFVGAQVAATTSLRPEPFALGAIVAAIGALLSLLTRDTAPHVRVETIEVGATAPTTFRDLFADVSWRRPALFSASQAGLANNLNDGVAWGLLPLFFMDGGLGLHEVGILAAVYPGVWGLGQIASGALSDKIGRRPLIATGMVMQACALAALVPFAGFGPWVVAMITLGLGTAFVYPTLLAVIADVVHPSHRATATGIYRFWRDAGYVAGALLAGAIADRLGARWAIEAVAALTLASAIIVLLRLPETHRTVRRIA
ncbi:MAG TPA: MFS transporter [Candidatus Limnocylindria bacterium]|jgi:MFS family permease|nr:MFS transporter [Candidatus Limnocylindria bacterium]